MLDFHHRQFFLVIQEFIEPDDLLRNRVQPCEPGIVENQLQQLAGGIDTAVDAFVGELFGDDQCLVETQETLADFDEARRSGSDFWLMVCCDDVAMKKV